MVCGNQEWERECGCPSSWREVRNELLEKGGEVGGCGRKRKKGEGTLILRGGGGSAGGGSHMPIIPMLVPPIMVMLMPPIIPVDIPIIPMVIPMLP